jgi:hypothetical protein
MRVAVTAGRSHLVSFLHSIALTAPESPAAVGMALERLDGRPDVPKPPPLARIRLRAGDIADAQATRTNVPSNRRAPTNL